jgi:hypothetical protein
MTVPEEQRKQMIEAYGTRQGVERVIQHTLTALPIPQKLCEIIIVSCPGARDVLLVQQPKGGGIAEFQNSCDPWSATPE